MIQTHSSFTLHQHSTTQNDLYLTVSVDDPNAEVQIVVPQIYQAIQDVLKQTQAHILQERVFGGLAAYPSVVQAREKFLKHSSAECAGPLTYVQGYPFRGTGLAGIQIQALQGASSNIPVHTIFDDGIPYGKQWTNDGVTYVMLQNLHGLKEGETRKVDKSLQAGCMFDRADKILRACGGSYQDVVRTWIYLSSILDWYAEFNIVRSAKYQQWSLMPRPNDVVGMSSLRLPASTGIRGDHPLGASCVMDLMAIIGPVNSRPEVVQMTNRKQLDAFRYGRAFSRGASIRTSGGLCVHISGTAAIDEQGQSLFPEDARAQIIRTLDNIEALLAPVGANLSHIGSATVFLKRPEDVPVYQKIAIERGLSQLPAVCTIADVCRPELLFEMDAVVVLDSQ